MNEITQGESVTITGRVVSSRRGVIGVQLPSGNHVAVLAEDARPVHPAETAEPRELLTRDIAGPRDVRRSPGRPRKQIPA